MVSKKFRSSLKSALKQGTKPRAGKNEVPVWCVMLREQLRDAQWGSCGLTGAAGGKPLTSGQGLACRASFLSESLLEPGCKYL